MYSYNFFIHLDPARGAKFVVNDAIKPPLRTFKSQMESAKLLPWDPWDWQIYLQTCAIKINHEHVSVIGKYT